MKTFLFFILSLILTVGCGVIVRPGKESAITSEQSLELLRNQSIVVYSFSYENKIISWQFELPITGINSLQNNNIGIRLHLTKLDNNGKVTPTTQEIPFEYSIVNSVSAYRISGTTNLNEVDIADGTYDFSLAYATSASAASIFTSSVPGTLIVRGKSRYVAFMPADEKYSAYPPEILAFTDSEKEAQRTAGRKLKAQILNAIRTGEREFKVPPGHYRLPPEDPTPNAATVYLVFQNIRNFTLDGQGSTFWLESRQAHAILTINSDSITIKNFIFDYDPLPYIQGKVVALEKTAGYYIKMRFSVDPGFERSIIPYLDPAVSSSTDFVLCTFRSSEKLARSIKPDWLWGRTDRHPFLVQNDGTYATDIVFTPLNPVEANIAVGDSIAFMPRSGGMVIPVWGSSNFKAENLAIYSAAHIAVNAGGSTSHNVFDNIKLMRRPNTRRLISSNIDGFNIKENSYGPYILNSIIEDPMDDAIALMSFDFLVAKVISPTSFIVTPRAGGISIPIKVGEQLNFHVPKTDAFRGNAIVTTVGPVYKDPALAASIQSLGAAAGLVVWSPTDFAQVTVSKPLASVVLGDVVIQDQSNGGFRIENNLFLGGNVHSMLVSGNGGSIRNNIIYNTGSMHIGRSGDWLEGTFPKSILIENNLFSNIRLFTPPINLIASYGDGQANGIQILNNIFSNIPYAAMSIQNSKGTEVSGNTIIGANQKNFAIPNTPELNSAMVFINSIEMLQSNNVVEQPGPFMKNQILTLP